MKTSIRAHSLLVHIAFYATVFGAYNASVDKNFSGADGTTVGGTKMYATIASAINGVPSSNSSAYYIYIKNGRYVEHVTMNKPYVTLIGQDRDSAVLSFNLAQGSPNGSSTWGADCATIKITASNFTAMNMTFENAFDYLGNMVKDTSDAGYIKSAQALTVRTAGGSNRAFFKNCVIAGYQDPLFAELGTQYYKKCVIKGAVDFIYGGGQAAFDSCDIVCRNRPNKIPMGYITAPSTQSAQAYGLVFFNCTLKKEITSIPAGSYSLGRPWHPSAGNGAADPNAVGMSVYMNCWMDDMIKPVGWDSMSGKDANGNKIWFVPYKTTDSRLYEYKSAGPGAIPIANPPYRKFLTDSEAANYTVLKVLGGWLPDESTLAGNGIAMAAAPPPRIHLERKRGNVYLKIKTAGTITSLSTVSVDGRMIPTSSSLLKVNGEYAVRLEFGPGSSAMGKGVYFITCRTPEGQFTSRVYSME